MARLADLRSRVVLRVADELGIPHAHAVGLRELLYATVFQKADATIGDERDVELTAGWEGDRGSFVAAARAAGMIVEIAPGTFVLPDFEEAAPAWAKKRATRAKRRKATGKTISDLRSEAGLKGAVSRANKRDSSGRHLNPTRQQTAPLPTLLPSLIPTDQPEGLRPSSTEEPGPQTATRRPTKGAVEAYCRAWENRYGVAPHPPDTDVIAANRALKPYPPEEREAIAEAFVEDDDQWVSERAHRLGHLPAQIDRLRAKLAGTLRPTGPRRDRGYTGRRSITPPGFRHDEPTPEGVTEIAASDDPEAHSAVEPLQPPIPDDLARLLKTYPRASASSAPVSLWTGLGPEDRELALAAAAHLERLWRLTTPHERGRVPPLAEWLARRSYLVDEEDREADIFGARRFSLAGDLGRAAESHREAGGVQ